MLLTLLQSLLQKLAVVANPTHISWLGVPGAQGYQIGARLPTGIPGTYPYQAYVGPQTTSASLSQLTPTLPTPGTYIAAVRALQSVLSESSSWSQEAAFTIAPQATVLPTPIGVTIS